MRVRIGRARIRRINGDRERGEYFQTRGQPAAPDQVSHALPVLFLVPSAKVERTLRALGLAAVVAGDLAGALVAMRSFDAALVAVVGRMPRALALQVKRFAEVVSLPDLPTGISRRQVVDLVSGARVAASTPAVEDPDEVEEMMQRLGRRYSEEAARGNA